MLQGRRTDWKKQGIYCITCAINGKKYIGQSKNIYARVNHHKYHLIANDLKSENQYFIDDWNAYGYENFNYEILELFTEETTKQYRQDRECYWIEKFDTINREKGYNLRRDKSGIGMIPLDETRKKYSLANKKRFENPKEREKIGIRNSLFWKNNPKTKEQMAKNVSVTLTAHKFQQFTKTGELIKEWDSVHDILKANPTYKRHNIYAVCSGEKPTMYGYIWRKTKIKILSE